MFACQSRHAVSRNTPTFFKKRVEWVIYLMLSAPQKKIIIFHAGACILSESGA